MKAADLLEKNYKNCLVVEDALAGCIAAKSASMHVAAISSAYGSPYADYHLNTFKDLLETLYLIFDYPYKYYTFKHFEV